MLLRAQMYFTSLKVPCCKVHAYSMYFQFDRFWLSLGVNDFGNLDYHQFLKEYSTTGDNGAQILRLSHSSHGRGRPHTSDSVRVS